MENKKKRRNLSLPVVGPILAHARGRFLPSALATPPSAHLWPTPRMRLLPLTRRPHSSVALAPRPTRDRSRWQAGPTSQPPRRPRRGHLRPPSSSLPRPLAHPLAAQESLAPPHPRRSGRVLARHRPAVRSRRRRCAALPPALCNLTGVRLAPPLPSPRAPIKGPP